MRKLLFGLLLLVVAGSTYGQSEVNYDFATQVNHTFQHLDKGRIPHGILLDYGMEFINLAPFDGLGNDQYSLNNIDKHSSIYKTIFSSQGYHRYHYNAHF